MPNYPFIEPTFSVRSDQLAICQSIYDANAFNTQNWREGFPINYDMLPELVTGFLNLLEDREVDFCIVGGIAYLAYVQDRNTKDLDILLSVSELEKIIGEVEIESKDENFVHALFEGMRVDFLKTSNALFKYVKENETTKYDFSEGKFPIATLNGLVLMRFDAIVDLYQKGNFNKAILYERDLQILTRNYELDWEEIWGVSENFFTSGQIAEFQKMVSEWRKPPTNRFAE